MSKPNSTLPELNPRQTAAILTGLRLLQYLRMQWTSLPTIYQDIESDGGTLKKLSNREIDDLCDAINL